MRFVYILFVIACFLLSCQNKKNVNEIVLCQIESLLQTYPDSALVLLDSVSLKPNDMYEQYRYYLYRIIAKDKSNKDIYMDKEILDIYNYFVDNDHRVLSYFSAFYCGKILQENKEYDQAVTYYNIAEASAKEFNDKTFQGEVLYTLGSLMVDQFLIDEAKKILMQADSLFIETGNHKLEIKSQKLLAFYYLMCDAIDSSLFFYKKALDLSIKNGDTKEEASILLNIGVILNEKGEHKEAIKILKEATQVDSIVCQSGKVFMNLAESYSALGLIDSARYYAECSLTSINNNLHIDFNTKSSAYRTFSAIEEKARDYEKALTLHKLYSENLAEVISDIKDKGMIDAKKKYKYETVQKENNILSVKQLKTQRFLFLSLLFIALLVILYNRKILAQNKQLNKANNEIIQLTDYIKDNTKKYNSTKESYRDNLVHNFNVLKRAASLEYYVRDSGNKQGKALIKSFNTVAYGKENIDWEVLYNVINSVYNGVFDLIKNKYTILDENEFHICCLIYSKFNSNEIAAITDLSINTVHMKTTYIRKKLGIEKYGNIAEYFNNNLNTTIIN